MCVEKKVYLLTTLTVEICTKASLQLVYIANYASINGPL